MFYSSKQKGTRTLAIAKAIVMADMLLIMVFSTFSMIFEKGMWTFKKLSALIDQTPFPTLPKDPMNKKEKGKRKFLLPRDENHLKKKLRVR